MPIVFKNKYEKEHSRVIYHTDPSPLINNPPAFRLQKPSTKDRAKGHCGFPLDQTHAIAFEAKLHFLAHISFYKIIYLLARIDRITPSNWN